MYTKKGIVDRFEEEKAVILAEDGQTLLWDQNNLPYGIKEGSAVVIEIKDAETANKNQQELAQKILHEIFNTVPK